MFFLSQQAFDRIVIYDIVQLYWRAPTATESVAMSAAFVRPRVTRKA